jgi:molybdate transport system permease protein
MKSRGTDPVTGLLSWLAILVIGLPILALVVKVPWSSYMASLRGDGSLTAITLSLWTSFVAATICLIFGLPLAWWLTRSSDRLSSIIRPIVLAPIALPPTVAGLALLGLLSRTGILGRPIFQAFGWQMPFTVYAVIFAGIFVGLPFLVLVTESTFRELPRDVEDAAVVDRASQGQLFRLIAIPQAKSGIVTGLALAWARILGEFGATMMFAGSLPGTTQTWTMQIYQELDINADTAYALSLLMVLIAVTIIAILRKPLRDSFRS